VSGRTKFESLWEGYVAFCNRVREAGPDGLSLRDKDRWLWGKSVASQLARDVATGFAKVRAVTEDDD
jgi:hypothetical protein